MLVKIFSASRIDCASCADARSGSFPTVITGHSVGNRQRRAKDDLEPTEAATRSDCARQSAHDAAPRHSAAPARRRQSRRSDFARRCECGCHRCCRIRSARSDRECGSSEAAAAVRCRPTRSAASRLLPAGSFRSPVRLPATAHCARRRARARAGPGADARSSRRRRGPRVSADGTSGPCRSRCRTAHER